VKSFKEGKIHEAGQPDGPAGYAVYFFSTAIGGSADDGDKFTWAGDGDLDAYGIRIFACCENIFHLVCKVIGIVVIDGNITIAREAKDTRGGYFFSWEKSAGMECYEIFEQDESVRVIGERYAPSEALGERNEGISLGVALVVVYAAG
jgi:hypothetical protein